MVWVAALMAGTPGNGPIVTVGGCWVQPEVLVALQAAVLIMNTLRDGRSAAYRVCVASSIAPTLAPGAATGISATGAHPARCAGWQVAEIITSICGWLRLPA